MQTLTDIKSLLAAHGLRPKHRLGQNFLHDQNHMRRIVEAADIHPVDLVLEVGAGTGSLSEALLDAGAQLVAVEVDQDLTPILRERLDPYAHRAHVCTGDILASKSTINPQVLQLLEQSAIGHPPSTISFKLVANLPYQIASPLLIDLALDHPAMQLGIVMVQREVADRLTAPPGSKAYGPLSVLVQAMCATERIAALPASCFWPAPKVASAVVRLTRRAEPATDDPHRLAALVQRLFQQRRKQLGAILGREISSNISWPEGVEPTARPERLSVDQLVALAERVG